MSKNTQEGINDKAKSGMAGLMVGMVFICAILVIVAEVVS